MLGYIVPCVPELKVREMDLYRQYYCGLCRALKEKYGRIADLAYDATFIHVLADGLTDETTAPKMVRCAAHGIRGVSARTTKSAPHAADVNMLMAYAKAADDAADGGGIRPKLLRQVLRRHKRRAQQSVPSVASDMEQCTDTLHILEQAGCDVPDEAAEPYGILFGRVLSDLDIVQSHILYDLGYNIGRWVYLIDAWDDMEKDEKEGQYNVYNARMRSSDMTKDELRAGAAFSLHYTLSQAADALDRLELKKNRDLLNNIVRLGLFQQTRSVLSGMGRLLDGSIQSTRRL